MSKLTKVAVFSVSGANLSAIILGLTLFVTLKRGVFVGVVVKAASLYAVFFLFKNNWSLGALNEGLKSAIGIIDIDLAVGGHDTLALIGSFWRGGECVL